jgi:hypothetical protein
MGADFLGSFIESTSAVTGDSGHYCAYYDSDVSRSTSITSQVVQSLSKYFWSSANFGTLSHQTAKDCLSKDPILARGSEIFNQNFLELVDSVETWTSNSQEISALKLSLKVFSLFPTTKSSISNCNIL